MIYNGCKYLLQHGYLTDEPYCEVCALKSNDIHIEEHQVVRSRYLERKRQERGMTMRNNDLVQIDWTENECFSDESNMIAGMSLDVDEVDPQLAAPVQSTLIPIDADYSRVQEDSIESVIIGRDSLLSGNELVVSQGNPATAHSVRTNEGNTPVSGPEDIQAARLMNAVNIGLLFSQMMQNQLQSWLENEGYSVTVSSSPYDEIGASPDNPIDLSTQPRTEAVPIAATPPAAIHRPVFHAKAPHNIHERLTGSKILPAAQQTTKIKPNACHTLAGNISTTVSGSIQPGSSKRRLPQKNIVGSRESQLEDASIKPDTNRFSAEWPMVSSQQIPLNNKNINHSQQRKATRNNSLVSSRTRGRIVTKKSRGRGGGSSMPLLKNHDRDRHGLVGTPSSGSEMAVDFSAWRNEQLMSEHLYARREPMAAEISKRNTRLGHATRKSYGSIRAIDSESQEVVMTPLARQLYTSGDPKSMANPTTTTSPRSLSGNILRGILPYCTAATAIPPRQEPKARQLSTNRNMRSGEALSSTNRYKKQLQLARVNHLVPTDEIVIPPLVKNSHTPGNSVPISNTDSYAMPANGNVIVDVAPPGTVTFDPAVTPSGGAIVPWSASSTRTLPLNHRVNLHSDLPLPSRESIGGHLQPRGIKESRGPPSVSLHAPPAENINNIMEWLMLSSNNTDELPSPHPSLLSITSGDSGGSTVPSGGLIGQAPMSITSGDSGRSTNPEPMSITSGISSGDTILGPALLSATSGDSAGFAPWPTTSEDSECPICEGPTSIMSTESAGSTDQVPQNKQSAIKSTVSAAISELQNGVTKPRNRRKSTVPRKKRPKTLKQPTTNRGKVGKSPNPPSRKYIEHFIIVCGEEAFRVNSRVLEEASPVVRDFSKACLQAGSTGDCFFEVLGVTPWAMHELLKYVCHSSYNRNLMRSSSVKTLAEKLKIKISDGYPQQDSNDASPANPPSTEDGFIIN